MSSSLYLVRRWGQNPAGETVTVDDAEQAQWLLDNNFAQRSQDDATASAGAAAPGGHGADPRAGGDSTRRRPIATPSSDTRENRATPVAGSPVQYNAGVAPSQGSGEGDGESSDSSDDESGPSSKISAKGRRRSS